MTIGEVTRKIESWNRCHKRELQQKASMDYALADLIGISVSRCASSVDFPQIYEVYPDLFSAEEIQAAEEQKQAELYSARFMQWAQQHNLKMKGGDKGG